MTRRHLLERELGEAQALRIAEAYLAEERHPEAVAFLQKAGATERLRELLELGVEQGDAFLVKEAARALREPVEAERWRALREAARTRGKLRYAAEAERQIERLGEA